MNFLPVAAELAAALAEEGVRYGAYKNVRFTGAGLAGERDIDLLVAAEDAEPFRTIVRTMGGVRGIVGRFYDNAVDGREDWFLPDVSGRYLHLDTNFGLRVGRKFAKRYLALDATDVAAWAQVAPPAPPLPVATPIDEARFAVLRSVFRLKSGSGWVRADSTSTRLLREALAGVGDETTLEYRVDGETVTCRARRRGTTFELEGAAIRSLRRLLRRENGAGPLAALADLCVHHVRRVLNKAAKILTRGRPGRAANRRRLANGGVIIALIGPDGVGKSTQTARLTGLFREKFRCTSVYLGSNDGDWMKVRAILRRKKSQRKARKDPSAALAPKVRKPRGPLQNLGSAFWRLVIAIQRHAAMRKALRLAASGAVVICDRWPQTIACGYLDGPSVPPPKGQWLAGLLWRIERGIYARMERHRATATIHLDCDFATSHQRKPGDIEEVDFERRIALMQEMRRRDPAVQVVDARQDMDAVTRDLAGIAWRTLWDQENRAGA